MRISIRLLVFFALIALASSAFAADRQTFLLSPDYLHEEEPGVVWGPTYKSVQAMKFDHETFNNVSAMSLSDAAFEQPQATASVVTIIVGFNAHEMEISHVERHGNGTTSYRGLIEGSKYESFYVRIGDAVAGQLHLPDGSSRDLVTRGDTVYVVEMDDKEIARSGGCLVPDRERSPLGAMSVARMPVSARVPEREPHVWGCRELGQVLVWTKSLLYVYDTTLLSRFDGDVNAILAFAQACVDGMNAVHVNSLIPEYRVKLVGVKAVNYTSVGDLTADDLWLQVSPEIAALKTATGAVEVGLIIGTVEGAGVGLAGGGFLNGLPPIHTFRVGGGVNTAIHEEGHGDGAGHQAEDWTGSIPVPYGYGWFKNGFGRDIMAIYRPDLCPEGCLALPVLSNPNVFYGIGGIPSGRGISGGIPVGIPDQSENWRMPALAYPALGATASCVPE